MSKYIMTHNGLYRSVLLIFVYVGIQGCVTPNPDFSQETVLEEGLITVAGDNNNGELNAGEPMTSGTVAGEQVAGEQVAGEPVAGEPVAGEQVAGEQVAGEQVAGEQVAGEQVAGEQMVIDRDQDGFSPPLDCNDNQRLVNPEATEVCDRIDNDCDEAIDEGSLNRCGSCGPEPEEVCDTLDNDCDGEIDEGTLNACGSCGSVPVELCDTLDNDCDGDIDEGTLNACGTCGTVPVEVCDNTDNDCDGDIDEGTLNACGRCGAVPNEVCDGADNDCDDRTDEDLPLNACGQCGDLPLEICDGIDNDCDDQTDEDQVSPCFTLKDTIVPDDNIIEMGSLIKIVGDLDGDGADDALIRSQSFDEIRILAYSSHGTLLWSIEGQDDFGTAITSGYYFDSNNLYIAVNDPYNDRVILYTSTGTLYVSVNTNEGAVTSMTTLSSRSGDTLALGIPDAGFRGRGLIKRLRFNLNNPMVPAVIYSTRGDDDQYIGERIYNTGNILGNNVDDLLTTATYYTFSGSDRGTILVDGSDGFILDQSLYRSSQDSFYTFAESLVLGKFDQDKERSFVYGAPGVSNRLDEQGGVFFLHGDDSGYIPGVPIYGQYEFEGIGLSLGTLPRPTVSADTLIIGGYGELTYRDYHANDGRFPVPLPINDLFVGLGLDIAKTPSLDGTYQMWVSGLSDEGSESRVWILRAR